MKTTIPRPEYPRPQFKRERWLNLNGLWNFSFDDDNVGEKEGWFKQSNLEKEIIVPFTFETKSSQIGDKKYHLYVWYQRQFAIPESDQDKRIILNFQAVDYKSKVWINGQLIGIHQGGYDSFSFDITDYVNVYGSNNLVVKVEDGLSCFQPRGKQGWKERNFACWYTRTTGIWQTVWLEFIENKIHFSRVKMTSDIDSGSINLEYYLNGDIDNLNGEVKTIILFKGKKVNEFAFTPEGNYHQFKIKILEDFHYAQILWTPDNPNLYDIEFKLYNNDELIDDVESYFGMRKISIKNGQVLLNNKPIYQRLVLDQGYWPDTLLTPPSDQAIKNDIELTKKMGFNGARKHQKVEDDRYYYWCDKMGLLVWSEMASTYDYSDIAITNFTREWTRVVKQRYNHPSIITWTPFNESWGISSILTDKSQQSFTESIYYLTKSLDLSRPVIVNDGWEHTISDIITLHDYVEDGDEFKKRYEDKKKLMINQIPHNGFKYALAEGYQYTGQPIQISEFGGIAFVTGDGWGYGNQVESEEVFLKRMKKICMAIKEIEYISGYCYTQLTDVQQEVNGLLTFDRKPKIDLEKIRKIID